MDVPYIYEKKLEFLEKRVQELESIERIHQEENGRLREENKTLKKLLKGML